MGAYLGGRPPGAGGVMSSPAEDTSLKFLRLAHSHMHTFGDFKYLSVVCAPAHFQIHLHLREVNRVHKFNESADKHFYTL